MFNRKILNQILQLLKEINDKETIMGNEVQDLQNGITAIQGAVAAAVTALQTLASEITSNSQDPAAMETAASALNTLATNLQAAVTAAIPPAPTPTS